MRISALFKLPLMLPLSGGSQPEEKFAKVVSPGIMDSLRRDTEAYRTTYQREYKEYSS